MLVLQFRKGAAAVVTLPDGRRMRVVFYERRGKKVALGFDAPRDVVVNRECIQAAVDAKTKETDRCPTS